MDNSMSSIPNPQPAGQPYPTDSSISIGVPNVPQSPPQPVPGQEGAVDPEQPIKRRPGRPKGSTKKNLLGGSPIPPKIKRPVGRPRKDGFPAGSVGPSRSRIKREKPISMSGVGYPAMGMYGPSISAPPPSTFFQIDPNLEKDDWAQLAKTDPNKFFGTLLSALAAPNPVSSAGPSVEEAFKSHLVSLAPNPSQMQPIPSLYSILKTFWLPSSPAYFSLTASASTARTPSEHRFLYWDPQPLVFNGISCPNCSAPLINKGRISSGPVKIYDIEKPFFIIGCEYVCKSPQCVTPVTLDGRKFASTDSSILRALPVKLQDEFPAKLMYSDTDAGSGANIWNWKALGVSLSLWNMVQGALHAGLKKEIILHLIHCIQHGVPEDGDDKDGDESMEEDNAVAGPSGDASAMGGSAEGTEPEAAPQGAQPQSNVGGSNLADAYSDAWKENTAVTEGALSPNGKAPTPASQVSAAPSTTQSTGPNTQPYPTYTPFAYGPYSFIPPMTGQIINSPARAASAANVPAGSPATGANGNNGNNASESDAQEGSKRSPRHCCKCGSQECKGKGGRTFCTNACQDCGKQECKGRNSRRPDKKCTEGWL
ncbi:hypothetical protein BDQ17DRAFT_1350764 [Cyathus striatus]|nr:hypothetical protein BDQ17DRAFT_1350764 [Cyathus striatus]